MTAIVKTLVLLAAAGVAAACGWLAYGEYRFARSSNDLRVMWGSLCVGLLFVTAAISGLVGLHHWLTGLRKGSGSELQGRTLRQIASLCVLGAAAVLCCYLAIDVDAAERQGQLGAVDPGKVTGYGTRGGRIVRVYREGDSGPTGFLAYWFPALTGALSAGFTWKVGNAVRKSS